MRVFALFVGELYCTIHTYTTQVESQNLLIRANRATTSLAVRFPQSENRKRSRKQVTGVTDASVLTLQQEFVFLVICILYFSISRI